MRRISLVALGMVGLGGGAQRASAAVTKSGKAAAAASGRRYRVSAIDHVVDNQEVSVLASAGQLPLECVPAGWQPMVGDSVVVGPSPLLKSTSAEQISTWVMRGAAPQDLHPGQRFGGPSGPVITEATDIPPALRRLRSIRDSRVRQLMAAVTVRRWPDGRERVLAIRET